MKILIGVPVSRTVHSAFALCLTHMVAELSAEGNEVVTYFHQGTILPESRAAILSHADSLMADYLLFLDSDMTFEKHLFHILKASDVPIISAMTFKRLYPYQPCFYTEVTETDLLIPTTWEEDKVYEIAAGGLAATLIRHDAIATLIEIPNLFIGQRGEDIAFHINAAEAGVKAYVHTGVEAGHISEFVVGESTYRKCIK